MSEPFLSEIKLFAFNHVPKGWAMCNGQFLPINQNQALFALLGTRYGGNGVTTFALPDLRGRVPIHFGGGHNLGEAAGSESVTITHQTMPAHLHVMNGSTVASGGNDNPTGRFLGSASNLYHTPASLTTMNPGTIGNAGGSQPHQNMQPHMALTFGIALQGIFPSQN
ncbi:phage tail protein [Nocardioides bizhenqiangii]|uniref:Tail fiber protein n=1 Tax=Nocardioides bizhenqiangii TaxID=3095076 RepID=A0ABZ0ZWJ7_9ACTN|nr:MULTISPECIES: tail fiber protein [unclassified Nocardioides]MDZ5623244.1 tail fiber protein [Nocardioides sp. HM23]WQQ28216.1 tail fiber protein [Nocardioides sp. HM61]